MVKPLLVLAFMAFSSTQASSSAVATSSSSSSSSSAAASSSASYVAFNNKNSFCGPLEFLAQCPEAVCVPKTCDDVGFPISCLDLAPNGKCPSSPACVCNEGYVRNAKGQCIPMTKCPSCGGDPNARSGCAVNCNRLCSNYNQKNVSCILPCYFNGCDCKKGFVLNESTNKCVYPSKCPPLSICKQNEVLDMCPAPCPFRICGINDAAVDCVPSLEAGDPNCNPPKCRCKDGFYSNDVGECVQLEDCPKCLGRNEVYDPCIAPCPPKRCDVDDRLIKCARPPVIGDPKCVRGCRCDDGFYRNAQNVCVTRDECPLPCKEGEKYERCPPFLCQPLDCTEVGFPIACPSQKYGCPSYAACICDNGYVRDSQGKCVPRDQCPSCKGDPNAVAGCGVYCNKRCRDIGKKPGVCIDICFNNACDCRYGYFLDENTGKCVLPEQCTPQCGFNEQYSECINGGCKARNCSQIGFPIPCPKINENSCRKGCICKDGYARNNNGICIPVNQCPSCGGDENAQPGCGINCNKQCSDIGKEPGVCRTLCKENACDCKEGYFFDAIKNKCVKPEQCTPSCGINEEFNECTNANCDAQNCTQLGFPIACPKFDTIYCKKGCQCKSGYVRNSKGICIPVRNCPSCRGDVNAQSGCGGYCNRRCSDIGKKLRPCLRICEINACDCKDGYYLDDNTNTCVKPENCSPTCGINEEYNTCVNANCAPQNCTQLGFSIPCPRIEAEFCKKGCQCKPGYARNDKGLCIPVKQCPSCRGDENAHSGCGGYCNRRCSDIGKDPRVCMFVCEINGCDCKEGYYLDDVTNKCVRADQCKACNKPNEELVECAYNCPPQTCESLDKFYACPIQTGNNCRPMCKCKQGYFRNKIGECITEEQCRKCLKSNEYYSCGGACDNVCKDLSTQNQTNCPIINIKCNEMCYCEKDYARALNNTCIPIGKCYEPQCPLNERYEACPGRLPCEPRSCSQLGKPITCPAENDVRFVKPSCVCIDGYVRNDKGICIPKNECPSCGDDPNAQSGCGVNCGKNCRDLLINDDISCIQVCNFNQCDCKDGFYYDSLQKKCVPSQECSDVCGENEVLDDCTNSICRAENCTQLGFPLNCDEKCSKRCVCKEYYARNEKGICVPVDQCPSCGGDPNAVSGCGVNCDKLCPNNNRDPRVCPKICYPNACDCIDGFAFDNNTKTCVKPEACSSQCKENEIFETCPGKVCEPQTCSAVGYPLDCSGNECGSPTCICKNGYTRNSEGICIPTNQCPTCGSDPNAIPGCGFNCGKRCPKETSTKLCPRIVCQPKSCDCKPGFLFDANIKLCVKPQDCSPICNDQNNEVFDSCVNGPCGWKNCSQIGGPEYCVDVKKCLKGCSCKTNYYRLDNGTCVPEDQCPKNCRYPNEVYDPCPPPCSPQTCESLKHPLFCPKTPANSTCEGQCRCKPGYYRNSINECIKKEDCLKCTGPKEYFSCGPYCDNVCSKLDTESKENCPYQTFVCTPRCYCEDGYARDNNGICIPICDCPR